MKRLFSVSLVFIALLSGCGNMTKDIDTAKAQVAVFHNQLDSGEVNGIITAADQEMFSSTSKDEAAKFLTVVHNKLGRVTETKNMSWNVQTFNSQSRVVLVQDTKFEKGSGAETFTFIINGDKAQLAGYYVNSRDLIMK